MSVRTMAAVVGAGVATAALLSAVGPSQSVGVPASPTTQAAAAPAVGLKEVPAFPLPAHVESKQIAGGAYTFQQLFGAGEALFHASYNGLDGVGSAVRKDGSKVMRFAPPGPRGPGSQACGECHAVPFPSSAGLAHSSVGTAQSCPRQSSVGESWFRKRDSAGGLGARFHPHESLGRGQQDGLHAAASRRGGSPCESRANRVHASDPRCRRSQDG